MEESIAGELASRLERSLSVEEGTAFEEVREQLAFVLARLWESYALLLGSHRRLTCDRADAIPSGLQDFRPGMTLRLGPHTVQTDPRLALADRLQLNAWQDLLSELAGAVLRAPDLSRAELLLFLGKLDPELARELASHCGWDEPITDEFPVRPSKNSQCSE